MDKIPVNVAIRALNAAPKIKDGLTSGLSASAIVASLDAEAVTSLNSFVGLFSVMGSTTSTGVTTVEQFLTNCLAAIDFHKMTPEEEQRWWDRAQGGSGA